MPTIELTIDKSYVPEWGLWEGVREIIQNAVDGEKEYGARMEVQYRENSKTLAVKNHGVAIPKEALLIGFSTKRNKEGLRGQFGEGLDLGLLALVREGMNVTIRSADEVWKPVIERSSRFDAHVLKVKTSKASVFKHRTAVEISPIEKEEWETLKKLFIFLADKKDPRLEEDNVINVTNGTVFLHEEMKGMIFVKGIFIDRIADMKRGYDLKNCTIDRDRRMIDAWDLKWKLSSMWTEALNNKQIQPVVVYQMLEEEAEDTKSMPYMEGEGLDAIAETFIQKHGECATPVSSMAQSKEVGHFGRSGIVVNNSLRQVLEKKLGTYETRKRLFTEETIQLVSWQELTNDEQEILTKIVRMVERTAEIKNLLDYIKVVDFQDKDAMGMYKKEENKILLSRKILSSPADTLATLTHEYIHADLGAEDGSKNFHFNVEELLSHVAIDNWMEKNGTQEERI